MHVDTSPSYWTMQMCQHYMEVRSAASPVFPLELTEHMGEVMCSGLDSNKQCLWKGLLEVPELYGKHIGLDLAIHEQKQKCIPLLA